MAASVEHQKNGSQPSRSTIPPALEDIQVRPTAASALSSAYWVAV